MIGMKDDRRREVADGLRHQVKRLGPQMDAHEFAHYGADVIDPDNELRWDQMMLRLADLIDLADEMCELELTWSGDTKALVRTYECSRCGKSCDRVYGEDYRFCPYCGRRSEHVDE